MPLTLRDFSLDRHAATYLAELDAHPAATNRLLALLNDPENEQRLIHASELDRPALVGIVRFIEADPEIVAILNAGAGGYRFRQAVGVATRLKMEQLGWTASGRKGAVSGAAHFTKAERYTQFRAHGGRAAPAADRPG